MGDTLRCVPRHQSDKHSLHHVLEIASSAYMCVYRYDAFLKTPRQLLSSYPFYCLPRAQLFVGCVPFLVPLFAAWGLLFAVSFFVILLSLAFLETYNHFAGLLNTGFVFVRIVVP